MSTGYTSIDTTKGKLQNDPNANFKNTSTDINDIDDDKVSNDDEFPILINTVSQLNIFLRNFPLPSTTSAPAEPLPLKKTPEQIPYPPTSAPTSAPTSEPAPTSATSNPNTNELILHLSKYTSVKDNKLQSEYDRIKNTGNNNGLTDDKLTVDLFKLLSDNIKNVDFTIYNVLNDVDRVAAPTVIYLNSSIDDLYTILKHTNKTPINQSDNPTPKSSIESDDDAAYDKVIKAKFKNKPPKPDKSTYNISIVKKLGSSTIQATVTENPTPNADGTYTVVNVDMTLFDMDGKNKSLQTFMKNYSADLFRKMAENLSDWTKAFTPFNLLFTKKWEGDNNRSKPGKEFVQGVVFGRKMLRKGDYLYVFQHSDANLKLFMYIGNRINHSSVALGWQLALPEMDQETKDIKKRIDDLLIDDDKLQEIATKFTITKTDLITKIKGITPGQYFLE